MLYVVQALLLNGKRMQNSPKFRPVWAALGLLALLLGVIGIVLPVLPTTPFVLLAAFCFAKGAPRLHDWLHAHPRFGPMIADWRDHGAISRRAKFMALGMMAAALGLSVALGLSWLILGIQAACMGGAALFILSRPDA